MNTSAFIQILKMMYPICGRFETNQLQDTKRINRDLSTFPGSYSWSQNYEYINNNKTEHKSIFSHEFDIITE